MRAWGDFLLMVSAPWCSSVDCWSWIEGAPAFATLFALAALRRHIEAGDALHESQYRRLFRS